MAEIKRTSVSLAEGWGRAYVSSAHYNRSPVYVCVEIPDGAEMLPKQARRLAAALIEHANLAEDGPPCLCCRAVAAGTEEASEVCPLCGSTTQRQQAGAAEQSPKGASK